MTRFDDLPEEIREYIYQIWAEERAVRVRAAKLKRRREESKRYNQCLMEMAMLIHAGVI